MKQVGKNEIKNYIINRLREEDLRELCPSIVFDNKYPGLMTVFEQDKCMVINLDKFYSVLSHDGISNSLANLILFQAAEHEIAHLRQYRDVHKLGKRDDKNFAIFKSLSFSHRIPIAVSSANYNSLYHEYAADISAVDILLNDRDFIQRARTYEKSDLECFNAEMAKRILRRYRIEGDEYSPLALFIIKARSEYDYLSYEDTDRLLGFLYTDASCYQNLLDGRDLNNRILDALESVSDGKTKSENILKLVK